MIELDLIELFSAETVPPTPRQRRWLAARGIPHHALQGRWPGPFGIGRVAAPALDALFRFDALGRHAVIWPARVADQGDVVDLIAIDLTRWQSWSYLGRVDERWWIAVALTAPEMAP